MSEVRMPFRVHVTAIQGIEKLVDCLAKKVTFGRAVSIGTKIPVTVNEKFAQLSYHSLEKVLGPTDFC